MRVRHAPEPLPRDFSGFAKRFGILGEVDIKVRHTSRLAMKAVMFTTRKGLRGFWKHVISDGDLGNGCLGCVNKLGHEVHFFPKGGGQISYIEVDARYFAVMGLIAGHCTMEILCHESVHAGFAYAKRVHKKDLWHNSKDLDEEDVCYPTGRIAGALAGWCHRHNYYEKRRVWRPHKRPLAKKRAKK
jgi:hypothetical protein